MSAISWDIQTIKLFRDRILCALSNIRGLSDIESDIVYESYLTPVDLKNSFNSYHGAAFGLSPILTQTNYFRPHLKSDSVENLYFVGNSVHPGPEVSIVLLSSKLAAEEIAAKKYI